MKRLLLILTFLLLTTFVNGQYNITQNLGSGNTLVQVPANGALKALLINRPLNDTTAANLTNIKFYPGAQIFTADNQYWVRDATAQFWINISSGGGTGDFVPFYGCVSGCTVTWLQNYDYEVAPSIYYINGIRYESPKDTVTLAASDPTFSRLDAFVLNTSNAAAAITGTPAATPEEPNIDPSTQLQISFALVEANTTAPTITNNWIYREDLGAPTEWNFVANPSGSTTINLASTNFPYAGTKDIEVTNMAGGSYFTGTSASTVNWGNYDALVFKIRVKGAWAVNRYVNIRLLNSSGGAKSPNILLGNGLYGFNSSTTGVYQNVTIPLADFGGFSGYNAISFAAVGNPSGNIGYYIDDIQLTNINYTPPSGTGTVTSFAAGNLSPLFTTTVTNATTSPTLSFALSNANAYTVFGNHTGSTGAPTYAKVDLSTTVTGNLPVTNLNSGIDASPSTFWRGDGQWGVPAGGSPAGNIGNIQINSLGSFGTPGGDSLTYEYGRLKSYIYHVYPTAGLDGDSVVSTGHSIIQGLNASPESDSAFAYLVANHIGVPLYRISLSGSGSFVAIKHHNALINTHNVITTISMNVLNDVRRNGDAQKTRRKYINSYYAIFANHNLKSWVNASIGTGVTLTGSWTTSVNTLSVGGKSGAGAYTNVLNDTAAYSFMDSTVIIGMIGSDGSGGVYNYSNYDIIVDGVYLRSGTNDNQTDGVSDGTYDNKQNPKVEIIRGLSYGSHTVKIVNKSSGRYLFVDYFGHLRDIADARDMYIFHEPYLSTAGYAISPANANDAIIDTVNAKVDSIVTSAAVAGYPIFAVRTNDFYDITTGLSGDEIHPNNTGHRQIYNAYLNSIIGHDLENGDIVYRGKFYFYQNGVAVPLPEIPPGGFINNSTVQQVGNFNIDGIGKTGTVSIGTSNSAASDNTVTIGTTAAGLPSFYFNKTGAGLNEKKWHWYVDNTTMNFRVLNDAENSATNWQIITRSGTSISSINFPTTAPILSGGSIAANTTTRIGATSADATSYATTLGLHGGSPYLSFYKSGAGTNEKLWDFLTDNTKYYGRLVNDANNNVTNWLVVERSSINVSSISLLGKTSIGTTTSGEQLRINGRIETGIAGTSNGGLLVSGSTSGTISIAPQAAAGTFNFNLPTTAGTSGYLLTSAGGGSSAMTWTDPSTITGVNIYNSNGSLTGTRTVTMSTNPLIFSTSNATGTTTSSALVLTANSLTSGTGMYLSSTSLSSGSLLDLSVNSTAAASNTQKGINVSLSGANSTTTETTYGIYSSNIHSSSSGINYGVYGVATTAQQSIGVYGDASGGTFNFGVQGNSNAGRGVYGTTSNGVAIYANSSSGYAFFGTSLSGGALYVQTNTGQPGQIIGNPTSTNTVANILRLDRNTSGTAADGIGQSLEFYLKDASGTTNLSNQLISKFTTAANTTRTSQFIISGVTNAVTSDWATFSGTGLVLNTGNLTLGTGGKINIGTGSNASIGTATLSSGTVTVNTTAVTSSSIIFLTLNTPSGTLGISYSAPAGSIVNGTSFVINSVSTGGVVVVTDNSTVNWWIVN